MRAVWRFSGADILVRPGARVRSRRTTGFTLVELLAGLAILGVLAASLVVARGRALRQWADADAKLRATRAVDTMVADWLGAAGARDNIPVPAAGPLEGVAECAWRTTWVADPAARQINAGVVRVEVFHRRQPLFSIDLLKPLPPPDRRGQQPRRRRRRNRSRHPSPFLLHPSDRPGFSLLEILLACTLAAMLTAAVLTMATALAKDRQRIEARSASQSSPRHLDLLRQDLASSAAMIRGDDALTLIGHNALNPATLSPDGRLARVTWRIDRTKSAGGTVLVREQAYLDDPVRPRAFAEIAAVGPTAFSVSPAAAADEVLISEDLAERLLSLSGRPAGSGSAASAGLAATRVPPRVRVRISYPGWQVEEDFTLR
ncbi:MAG: prepilin-type N-terminal cleavage/methylation domain-containing protein [Phycisphaerae bacterium]|nr:type II secretion system protein [Tepidisphaeraceae bacterium]